MKVAQSCPTLCDPMDYQVHGNAPGQNTGVGCHFLLQGIFPTQRANHNSCVSCIGRWILYHSTTWQALREMFSAVAQSCPTLCDPMNHSTPGLPVHYQLPEFTQTYVHRVRDAIQPSHPLSSPSPPTFNLSQHVLRIRWPKYQFQLQQSLQFSSVALLCPTLCDPMNHSMPGLPVHHQLPEFTQIHVYRVSDAIQPSLSRT